MTVVRGCIAATVLAVALVAPPSLGPVMAASCARTAMPFAGVAGANLEPTDYVNLLTTGGANGGATPDGANAGQWRGSQSCPRSRS